MRNGWIAAGLMAAAFPAQANVDVSHTGAEVAAAVPMIALDPANPKHVLVAWRAFSIPLRGNVPVMGGTGRCYLSLSDDGGKTFRVIRPPLTSDKEFCNAPWVVMAGKAIVMGATITERLPGSEPGQAHPTKGLIGLIRSTDGGKTWSQRVAPIGHDAQDRFAIRASIGEKARAWGSDGARGAYDPATHTLYVSGAHPAPPGSADHSQRFVTASHDGGKTFGTIYGFDDDTMPGRWDGDLIAAHGVLAMSYVGGKEPGGAVFGKSRDEGKTTQRVLVAPAADFSMADLVHVPVIVTDPKHKGRYAMALVGADNASARIYRSSDDGAHWLVSLPTQAEGVVKVTRVGLGYAPDGTIVAAWRGAYADGRYDLFATAAGQDGVFGPAMRVSTATSTRPATIPTTGFEGGDFVSWVSVDARDAHFAWADARDGQAVRVYYARLPLVQLKGGK